MKSDSSTNYNYNWIPPSKMGLFVLSETSAGFALFKAKDKKILKKDDFSAEVETAEGINSL